MITNDYADDNNHSDRDTMYDTNDNGTNGE